MGSRRHHEVSPGGEGQTHREHYDKDERQEDRRERREARQEAREHFRKERDKIREEIDMTHACLPRKLHVRLAEVEELVAQHKKEKLEFELPEDFQKIKAQIEKLADGDDNGVYESDGATKRELRRAMRNDLQTLRLTVRGLRTSLRRHVNHEDEKPEVVVAAPPVIVAPKPPLAPRPPRDRVDLDDGESSGSGASSPETGATPTDPAPAGPISVEVPPVVVGDVTVTTPEGESDSVGTGVSTPETDEPTLDEGAGASPDEGGDDEDETSPDTPQKTPDELRKEAIGKINERFVKVGIPKYDDEFRGWVIENHDTDGLDRIIANDAKDPFKEVWEDYVKHLIEDTLSLIKSKNSKVEDALDPYTDDFFQHLRTKDEETFIKDLRTVLSEDPDEVDGVLTYLDIDSSVYQNAESEIDEYLPNIDQILKEHYGVPEENINEKTAQFWDFFRKEDPVRMSQLIKRISEGKGDEDGKKAFKEAQDIYTEWDKKEYPEIYSSEEDSSSTSPVETEATTEAVEEGPSLIELARQKNLVVEGDLEEIKLKNSAYSTESIVLSKIGNQYSLKVPDEYKSLLTSELPLQSTPEDAINMAEELLDQISFVKEKVFDDAPEAEFIETPYTVENGRITFHERNMWNTDFQWKSLNVDSDISLPMNAESVAKTLNELYFKKNPSYAKKPEEAKTPKTTEPIKIKYEKPMP